MLRRAGPIALVLLLSGCVASTDPVVQDAPAVQDDGMVVTATRVEPLVHALDVRGRIETRTCQRAEPGECEGGALSLGSDRIGLGWERPVRDVADPAALFWRAQLALNWHTESLVDQIVLTVHATTPCGLACVEERRVLGVESDGRAPITLPLSDIYLEPGETGVRVRLEPVGYTETSIGEASIDYHLYGAIAGYRPVADAIVLA